MKHVRTISLAAEIEEPDSYSTQLLQIIFGFVLALVTQKGKGGETPV